MRLIITIFAFVALFSLASAFPNSHQINLQVTDSSGNVISGTFDFNFLISNNSDCSYPSYNVSQILATDSNGIVYPTLSNLNIDYTSHDYRLCIYRDNKLVSNRSMSSVPYSSYSLNSSNAQTLQGLTPSQVGNGTYVPYVGAISDISLGTHGINTNGTIDIGNSPNSNLRYVTSATGWFDPTMTIMYRNGKNIITPEIMWTNDTHTSSFTQYVNGNILRIIPGLGFGGDAEISLKEASDFDNTLNNLTINTKDAIGTHSTISLLSDNVTINGREVCDASGNCPSGSPQTNIFNQNLNTTDNVTFNQLLVNNLPFQINDSTLVANRKAMDIVTYTGGAGTPRGSGSAQWVSFYGSSSNLIFPYLVIGDGDFSDKGGHWLWDVENQEMMFDTSGNGYPISFMGNKRYFGSATDDSSGQLNQFTGGISSDSILQSGNMVCDASNNCGYLTIGGETDPVFVAQNSTIWGAINNIPTKNPFNQQLNTTNNVQFGNISTTGNMSVSGFVTIAPPTTNTPVLTLSGARQSDGEVFSFSRPGVAGFAVGEGTYVSVDQIKLLSTADIGLQAGGSVANMYDGSGGQLYIKKYGIGIMNTNPMYALDVVGNASISKNFIVGGNSTFVNNATFQKNVIVYGNFSAKMPHFSGYNNETQNFLNTANAQVMNLSNNGDKDEYLIHVTGNQNITFDQTGDYVVTVSPEFFQNSGAPAKVTFWIQKNGIDVPFSNSRYTVPNGDYNAPMIDYEVSITNPTTDSVRIMWWSDSTSTQLVTVTGLTAPTRPSIPSVLLLVRRISEVAP